MHKTSVSTVEAKIVLFIAVAVPDAAGTVPVPDAAGTATLSRAWAPISGRTHSRAPCPPNV